MTFLSALLSLGLGQFAVGGTAHFKGFVPDETTAAAVATPILRSIMGTSYWDICEPLDAKSVRSIEGRWVIVTHSKASLPANSDYNFEAYVIAIDPWSARVALFGPSHLTDVAKELKKIKSDKSTNSKPSR